jgi:hypothetical protein
MASRRSLAIALLGLGVVAAACSSGSGGSGSITDPKEPPPGSDSGPCDPNLVIQTDWFPEVEQGGIYQLVGPGGSIDKAALTYSGPLRNRYRGAHGVQTVEIRAGGDAVEQPPSEVLYRDESVDFASVSSDDAIFTVGQGDQPVTGVMTNLDISPQMLMWSPARYSITEFTDLADTRAPVLHFAGLAYPDYLISEGYITEEQADPSYTGDPSRWLESNGDVIQQGFATNEVFTYTNVLEGWRHPVDFFLIHWMGYENYSSVLSVRSDRLEQAQHRECLGLLVPTMQQAWVDFLTDPEPVSRSVIEILDTYDTFFKVTKPLNDRAIEMFSEFQLATNGTDATFGNFDVSRMNRLFEIVTDVYVGRGTPLASDARAADAYTNDFIDPSVGLPPGEQDR